MPEIITDSMEISETEKWIEEAKKEAIKSKCLKSKVGVVIVRNEEIISRGHNKITVDDLKLVNQDGECSPCIREHIHDNSRAEMCYAIHAEQMALINASEKAEGAVMYHAKIKNNKHVPIELPTCTVCNRMIKEAGVYFVTLQKEGYVKYSPNELNDVAFKHLISISASNFHDTLRFISS